MEQIKVLYTAEATVTGGREGHARSSDGRLEVDLAVPEPLGGGGGPTSCAPTRTLPGATWRSG